MSEKPSAEGRAFVDTVFRAGVDVGQLYSYGILTERANKLAAVFDTHTRALREENERLLERIKSDNAVCICGCPSEDHDDTEEGECCSVEDHECLRVCVAVRGMYVAAVEQLKAKGAERVRGVEALQLAAASLDAKDEAIADAKVIIATARRTMDEMQARIAELERHNVLGDSGTLNYLAGHQASKRETARVYDELTGVIKRMEGDASQREAILGWLLEILRGREVSDFALSFGLVREVWDLKAEHDRLAEAALKPAPETA